MDDTVRIADQWYVSVTSSLADDRTRVLKAGETFAVFDRLGDIPAAVTSVHGLYHEGTRFLSRLAVRINGGRPMLLNSGVRDDGLFTADLMSPDLHDGDLVVVRKGTLHLFRARVLQRGGLQEHIRLTNYGTGAVPVSLTIGFAADYRDIFEVRGFERTQRGDELAPSARDARAVLAYRGRDGVERRTAIEFAPRPSRLDAQEAVFTLALEPGGQRDIYFAVACEPGPPATGVNYPAALAAAEAVRAHARGECCDLRSGHAQFDAWLRRSSADLALLAAGNPEGPYAYAGVPWYSAPFGRDGILTALQCLWLDPGLARGTLAYLARTQATEDDPDRDAEPGKILHETRRGELAATGEIPFGQYYGSVDATPLFVVLAGDYYERTGDLAYAGALWPHVERALEWVDRHGDADGDGFVEYRRRSSRGLVHQGWKDSDDAIFHRDGRSATGAIALAEVQGYVYAARRSAAALARALGDPDRAAALEAAAESLRGRFEAAFWSEGLGMYALALDGDKRRCEVRASNAGHVLWSGIARPDRARRTAAALLGQAFFSGWGVRTIAEGEPRFNPMSYHNGSVWPHDNALIAMGCARYGEKDAALRILVALCEAAAFHDLSRIPELYCGFLRRAGEGPTQYPVACSPQAWASAAVFYLLAASLGIAFEPAARRITLCRPMLPAFLDRLEVRNLRLADGRVDLAIERHAHDLAGVHVLREQGGIEVAVLV